MKKIQILLLLCLGILLTGCTLKQDPEIQVVEKIVYVKPDIPVELLTCKDINTTEIKTQADVSRLIIDLDEAFNDCKGKLASINKLLK